MQHMQLKIRHSEVTARRILIVDSDVDAGAALVEVLSYYGYTAQACCSAEDGLALLSHGLPDVCVSSICLPDMDGYRFAHLLRQCRRYDNMKLIALTGYVSDMHRLSAQRAGFDLHLAKPVSLELLLIGLRAPAAQASEV